MATTLAFKENFLNFKQYASVSLRFTMKAKPFTLVLLLPLVYFWFQIPWKDLSPSNFWANTGYYALFLSLLLFSLPFIIRRNLRKTYEAARFMQSPVDFQFSDQGMDMKSTLTRIQMAWAAFHSFYDFGRYGVLVSGAASGFFLDFEALQLPNSKLDFLALLKNHQIPVK